MSDVNKINNNDRKDVVIDSKIFVNLKEFLPDNITIKLKDHQIEGIKFVLAEFQKGCILAHSMGKEATFIKRNRSLS